MARSFLFDTANDCKERNKLIEDPAWVATARHRKLLVPALAIALVAIAYSPALLFEYGFSEDYRLLAAFRRGGGIPGGMIAEGRPLFALWTGLFLRPVDAIGELTFVRWINIAVLGLVAVTVFAAWRRAGLGRWDALAAGVASVSLPSFQFSANMAAAGAVMWGALAAGSAALLTDQCWSPESTKSLPVRLLPALLFLAGLAVYQPAGMLFWPFALIMLSVRREPWEAYRSRLKGFTIVGATGMAAALVVFEIGKIAFSSHLSGAEREYWIQSLSSKLLWFMTFPLPHALNLWKLYPSLWLALAAFLAILGGVSIHHRGLERPVFRSIVVLVLIPLSYLPNMVVAESRSSFRSMLALSTLVFSLYVLLLNNQLRLASRRWLFHGTLAVFLVLGVASSIRNSLLFFALPQSRELALVRETVAGIRPEHDTILVVPSDWRDSLAPQVLYDEFGYPSTALPWSAASLTWLALLEQRQPMDTMAIRADTAGALPTAPDTVIDWSVVLRAARQRRGSSGPED